MRFGDNENFEYSQLKIFFFIKAFFKKAKKNICSSIGLALLRIDLKIISKKLLGLLNLGKAQTFSIHKLMGIVIVG